MFCRFFFIFFFLSLSFFFIIYWISLNLFFFSFIFVVDDDEIVFFTLFNWLFISYSLKFPCCSRRFAIFFVVCVCVGVLSVWEWMNECVYYRFWICFFDFNATVCLFVCLSERELTFNINFFFVAEWPSPYSTKYTKKRGEDLFFLAFANHSNREVLKNKRVHFIEQASKQLKVCSREKRV